MLLNIYWNIEITPEKVIEEFSKKRSRKLQLYYVYEINIIFILITNKC